MIDKRDAMGGYTGRRCSARASATFVKECKALLVPVMPRVDMDRYDAGLSS